jgi:hypothetical protein
VAPVSGFNRRSLRASPLRHLFLLVSVAVLSGACDHGEGTPTSPTTVSLALSLSTVTVPRYGSIQTTLRLTHSDGTSQDVTGAAVWDSTAAAIATVQAGLVTAVGIGTARVTASYSGITCALDVVARRNTRLVGSVTVEAKELNGIQAVRAELDGRMVNGQSFSGTRKSWTIVIGQGHWASYDTSVPPGAHTLTARVTLLTRPDLQVRGASDPSSYVEVRDSDTDEVLARILLPVQEQTGQMGSSSVDLVWPLQIELFR